MLGYVRSDRFKRALIRSFLRKGGRGSIDNLAREVDPDAIAVAIKEAYADKSVDEIISEVRR